MPPANGTRGGSISLRRPVRALWPAKRMKVPRKSGTNPPMTPSLEVDRERDGHALSAQASPRGSKPFINRSIWASSIASRSSGGSSLASWPKAPASTTGLTISGGKWR